MWLTTDELNIVPALAGGYYDNTITTNFPCQPVNLGKYDSVIAIVSLTNPSTVSIWAEAYAALTPTGAGAAGTTGNYLPIGAGNYRTSNSTGNTSDTLSSRTALATTTISVTAATTSALNYYIEVKTADMPSGLPYFAVAISTSATASTGMCVNYIMKPRYPQKTMLTAIS